jgi:hypothetical protein
VRRISLSEFEARVLRFAPDLRNAYVAGFRRAALRLERYTVEEIDSAEPYPAVDTRTLRGSVSTEFVPDGAIVTVDAPHAPMMEFGTRPFFPPIGPLVEWAQRKGLASTEEEAKGVAFAIAKRISQDGIAPRRYFAKAWDRMRQALPMDVVRELAKIRGAR